MKWTHIVVGVLVFASSVFAQSGQGAISGTLRSPDGDVVQGVAVRARNTATGTVYTMETPRTGVYTLLVPPGAYEISTPMTGFLFLPYQHTSAIAVQAGQTVSLDIRLGWQNLGAPPGDDIWLLLHNKYAGKVTGPVPRTADGKPDLSGMWLGRWWGAHEVKPVMPALLPWAQAVADEWRKNDIRDWPHAVCRPALPVPALPMLYKNIQTPTVLVQFLDNQAAHYRQVFLDGRPHPVDVNPTWMGHSIGTWKGDTLVIDSIGFNDKTWLPNYGPHTEQLHITERYRRLDLGRLQIDITFDDPGTFVKPWQVSMVWELVPGEEIQEYVCAENNRYLQLIGGQK